MIQYNAEVIILKKTVIFLLVIAASVISFSEINFFLFLGNTESRVTFILNSYPGLINTRYGEIKLTEDNHTVFLSPGILSIIYKGKTYELNIKKGENTVSFTDDGKTPEDITLKKYTEKVSPNGDWINDNIRVEIYSNVFSQAEIEINGEVTEKEIIPGLNTLSLSAQNLKDGDYTLKYTVGKTTQNLDINVDRSGKTNARNVVITVIAAALGFMTYQIIK